MKQVSEAQDLFYRLNVVALTIPDLRERREDIPLLATYVLRKHANERARRITGLSEEALTCLAAYDWPGNVRGLENVGPRSGGRAVADTAIDRPTRGS